MSKRLFQNTLKAFVLLVSGSIVFLLVISVFPTIGSMFLNDFPLMRALKEIFLLVIPFVVVSFILSPVLGYISIKVHKNRLRNFIMSGVLSYWFALFVTMFSFSGFDMQFNTLINLLALSVWGFAAYAFFALPVVVPVFILLEKWTRNKNSDLSKCS